MRKVREVLRLHYAAGMSLRAVARSLKRRRRWGSASAAPRRRVWAGRCRTRWMMRGGAGSGAGAEGEAASGAAVE